MDIRTVTTLAPGAPAGLPGGFQAWERGRLVGSLTLFIPLGHTAQVSVFVPTEHRRKGIFSALLAEAKVACRAQGAKRLLLVCGGESGDGQAVAARWGLALDHSEYVLVCKGPRPEGTGPGAAAHGRSAGRAAPGQGPGGGGGQRKPACPCPL